MVASLMAVRQAGHASRALRRIEPYSEGRKGSSLETRRASPLLTPVPWLLEASIAISEFWTRLVSYLVDGLGLWRGGRDIGRGSGSRFLGPRQVAERRWREDRGLAASHSRIPGEGVR